MRKRHRFRRGWAVLLALASLSSTLAISASCDSRHGVFDFQRFDDHHGFGGFDFFVNDCGFFDCFLDDEFLFF